MVELADLDLKRRNADREFLAAIHGVKLSQSGQHAGRTYGVRHSHMERMKRRRGNR